MLTAVSVSAQAPAAINPQAVSLAHVVDAHYNHLQSLRARYAERYQGAGFDRTETGTLLLRKPGKMRWAYDSPAGKVFVLDGKWATFYTPGSAQAQREPAKKLDDLRSPLRFLLGHTELAKELDELTLTAVSPGVFTLSGVPKGMAARVRALSLTVTASGIIQQMRLEEADGATTSFAFSEIAENVPTKDADFVFAAPPGVAVITQSN